MPRSILPGATRPPGPGKTVGLRQMAPMISAEINSRSGLPATDGFA